MPFQPKLVAFDLDGTLAESKQRVTEGMGKLLGSLLEIMPVAVLSGAAFEQFDTQLLPALPRDAELQYLYLFPTSGAACYVFQEGAWHAAYNEQFSDEEKARVMEALHEALRETGLDTPPEEVWGERIEDRGGEITFSALGQQAPIEAKRAWDPDMHKRMPLRAALMKTLPEYTIRVNATTSVDITKKDITKAYGIRQLSRISGIAIEDMLYVGDSLQEGGNDAVVLETGVRTHAVSGPHDSELLIQQVLQNRT